MECQEQLDEDGNFEEISEVSHDDDTEQKIGVAISKQEQSKKMRKLWSEHVFYTREVIVLYIQMVKGRQKKVGDDILKKEIETKNVRFAIQQHVSEPLVWTIQRLLKNQEDIGKPLYSLNGQM